MHVALVPSRPTCMQAAMERTTAANMKAEHLHPTPTCTPVGTSDANAAVDSTSSMYSFAEGSGSYDPILHRSKKWLAEGTDDNPKEVPSTPESAAVARSKIFASAPMSPPNKPISALSLGRATASMTAPRSTQAGSTVNRLSALERCILGEHDCLPPSQAPLQRLAWLDTQLGETSGTVLERLNALEIAAEAQGLL